MSGPGRAGSPRGNPFAGAADSPKAGSSWSQLASPRPVPGPTTGRLGVGGAGGISVRCCMDFRWENGGQARGFFLEGLVRLQGRDASDQHIVTVMMKMMQGESRVATPPLPNPSPPRRATLQQLLPVALPKGLQAGVLIPALLWGGREPLYISVLPGSFRRPRRKGR